MGLPWLAPVVCVRLPRRSLRIDLSASRSQLHHEQGIHLWSLVEDALYRPLPQVHGPQVRGIPRHVDERPP